MAWKIDLNKELATKDNNITFAYDKTQIISITNIPIWVDHNDLYLLVKEANLFYLSEYREQQKKMGATNSKLAYA